MQVDIEKLKQIYEIQDGEQFEDYVNKGKILITIGKTPSDDKTLVIIGGQPGSGKSGLLEIAENEMENNAVVINLDELRAIHPSYKVVAESYPEITYRILQDDVDRLKAELVKFLIQNKYNVICEGALRDTKTFLKFVHEFTENDYEFKLKVMAVPKLESYGSAFVRYAYALLTNQIPRWIEKNWHDESYDGMLRTIKAFQTEGLADDISVYVRGKDTEERPQKIYSTEERQFRDPIAAVEYGRELDRKKAVKDFPSKYKMVKGAFEDFAPELLDRIDEWEKLYQSEQEYFNSLNSRSIDE